MDCPETFIQIPHSLPAAKSLPEAYAFILLVSVLINVFCYTQLNWKYTYLCSLQGCQPFFKILTLLTENTNQANSSSQPCFTQLVLQKVWEAAECCPYTALDWLALQVTRNRLVHSWVLNSIDSWLEHFLMAHNNQRVRNSKLNIFN